MANTVDQFVCGFEQLDEKRSVCSSAMQQIGARVLLKVVTAMLIWAALTESAATQPVLQCKGEQKPWMVAELLFGRGNVSDRNWDRFLADEVTPRFPDGLTVFDAKGQWRNPEKMTRACRR
jgi:hypothetical protein